MANYRGKFVMPGRWYRWEFERDLKLLPKKGSDRVHEMYLHRRWRHTPTGKIKQEFPQHSKNISLSMTLIDKASILWRSLSLLPSICALRDRLREARTCLTCACCTPQTVIGEQRRQLPRRALPPPTPPPSPIYDFVRRSSRLQRCKMSRSATMCMVQSWKLRNQTAAVKRRIFSWPTKSLELFCRIDRNRAASFRDIADIALFTAPAAAIWISDENLKGHFICTFKASELIQIIKTTFQELIWQKHLRIID